jgi:GINS complex subunit 2
MTSTIQPPSGLMLGSLSAEENEYLAKEELVTIISRIRSRKFLFMSGHFGPLEPGVSCDVPIWLALHLRKSNRCNIVIPEWLEANKLKLVLEDEKGARDTFQPMPFHYIEIAQMLLTFARDDFPNPDEVSTLVRDVENIRMDRLRLGAMNIAQAVKDDRTLVPNVGLTNISAIEILAVRRFLAESLATFKKLVRPDPSREAASGYDDESSSRQAAPRRLRRFRKDPS